MGKQKKITTVPELPERKVDAHKGDFGRVLVVGGSRGMIGAPALAADAALRGGAGLVTVAVPETVQLAVASLCLCATSIPLKCTRTGDLSAQSAGQMLAAAEAADVLAVGPGMGTSQGAVQLVRAALGQDRPVVLDADGLNNLARIDGWAGIRRCPLVLTPHPGEMARLTGKSIEQIQSDRKASTMAAAVGWDGAKRSPTLNRCQKVGLRFAPSQPTVVLKGAGTVVADGKRIYINETGNPGMATGGSGDVLTGLIAALVGQGLDLFEAACLGVHIHGLAGDFAAEELGQISLIASDLIDFLPDAIKTWLLK